MANYRHLPAGERRMQVRIPDDLHAVLHRRAAAQRRTFTGYARALIDRWSMRGTPIDWDVLLPADETHLPGRIKCTLRLSDDQHQRFRTIAFDRKRSLNSVIIAVLIDEIARQPADQTRPATRRGS